MMPIRLIATDLDGTLVHTDGAIDPANLLAVQTVRRAGIHIAVCTGRRHSYAMRALRNGVLLPQEFVLSSNGAVVRTVGGDRLWSQSLSPDLVRRLCQVLDAYRDALVLTFDRSGPDGTDVRGALAIQELDTLHRSIRRWMDNNAESLQRFDHIEDALDNTAAPPGHHPIQAMLCGTIARMREAEALLQQHFPGELDTYRTEYAGSDLCILDIMPAGVSKGTSLRRLAVELGIGMNEIMAVGDNWNDLPMLEAAGYPTVLENAPDELLLLAQKRGWTIGPPGEQHGFAETVTAALRRMQAHAG